MRRIASSYPCHGRARKGLGNQRAESAMLRRIGFLEGLARFVFLGRLILHADAAGRRKEIGLPVQFQQIGVAHHVPEALPAVGHVRPRERIFRRSRSKVAKGAPSLKASCDDRSTKASCERENG
jgi:hypothetical protein